MDKEQEKILEQRAKDLSERAREEEAAEALKPKAEVKPVNDYKVLADSYSKLSEKYSEGVDRVVAEAFMGHFKKNDFKSEGFGNAIYSALDNYFQKELLEFVPEDKGLARMVLKGYIGQIEDDKEQVLDFIKSEDKLSLGMVAQVGNFIGDKAEAPIKAAHMADVRKKATDDLEGFKAFLKGTAEEAGIPFSLEKITTVELGLKRYMGLMETIKKRKKEEEMLKKRFA